MTRIEKLSIGVAISFTAIGVYERVYGFGFDPATKEIISFAALFVTEVCREKHGHLAPHG